MNYSTQLAGVATMAATTTFYPLTDMNSDYFVGNTTGVYRYEMPAVYLAARSIYSPSALRTVQPSLTLETEFVALADKWRKETGFHSSLSDKFLHPAYQRIMAMGKPALPFILRDLKATSDHWFYALEYIAGDEGSKVAIGTDTISDARDAWLKWGFANGYL